MNQAGISFATSFGLFAILFWSMESSLVDSLTKHLPMPQILLFSGISCFIITSTILTIRGKWRKLASTPLKLWMIGIFFTTISDVCGVLAIKYAPASHVDCLYYTWPMWLVVLSSLRSRKICKSSLFSCSLNLSAIFLLCLANDHHPFKTIFILGYLLSMLDAFSLVLYTLIIRHYNSSIPEVIGLYSAIGGILSGLCYLYVGGEFLPMDHYDWLNVFLHGMFISSLAYIFWDFSARQGDLSLLSICAYFTPILSIILQIYLGKEKLNWAVITACLIIFVSILSNANIIKYVLVYKGKRRVT